MIRSSTRTLAVIIALMLLGALSFINRRHLPSLAATFKQHVRSIRQPDLQWTMVNVNHSERQGDAHLVQVRGGKNVLIDAGFAQPAKEKLIPFLKQNLVKRLDYVFISHSHKDHYEGIRILLDAGIAIHTVFFNLPPRDICDAEIPWGCDYDDVLSLRSLLEKKGAEIRAARPGQITNLGNGAALHLLYAFDGENTPVGKTDVNDLSLIMMLRYSGFRFLFTGDLNLKIGRYLADAGQGIEADVIKLPHHGTDGLAPNSFFERVDAKYALVPAPRGLWCKERSARARTWYEERNIPVYVNGFSGHIAVVVNDGELAIKPELDVQTVCPGQ